MSSIMRRRRGLISAIGNLLSEGLGTKNPGSFQTGGDCGRPLTAAQAASFNRENEIASFQGLRQGNLAISSQQSRQKTTLAQWVRNSSQATNEKAEKEP